MTIGRRNIDDAAAALRNHYPEFVLHTEQGAKHIGVEGFVVAFGGLVRHRTGLALCAGVVDRHIETTEAGDGLIDQVANVVVFANVGAEIFGLSSEIAHFLHKVPTDIVVPPGNHHASAFLGEGEGGARPMPVRPPVISTTGLFTGSFIRKLLVWMALKLAIPSHRQKVDNRMGPIPKEREMDRLAALDLFVRVVDSGSFSAVARHKSISQPAVSKAVAQLEEWLGVSLLLRSTRNVVPTEAGRSFYDRAKRTVEEADEAVLAARGNAAGLQGKLRVSAAVCFRGSTSCPAFRPFSPSTLTSISSSSSMIEP